MFPIGVPFLLMAYLEDRPSWLWWLAAGWGIAWLAFIIWRGARIAGAKDLTYDRKTKFELAEEYWPTESATKTKLNRQKKRRAQRKTA
ncbi:hypothetical protein [Pedomonas sp. V897]|uniref:hypothetical protein n=1 Tax=Pedomonas sp. V897 TaxID=3446482 RepID=UPI003EE34EE4